MYRLIEEFKTDGVTVAAGIMFKEIPKTGVLSGIPVENFEKTLDPKKNFVKKPRKIEAKNKKTTKKSKKS